MYTVNGAIMHNTWLCQSTSQVNQRYSNISGTLRLPPAAVTDESSHLVCRNIWFVWLSEAIYISWFYLPIQAFTAFMHSRNSVLSIQSIHYTSLSFFHHNLIEQVHLGCVLSRDSCHGRGSGSIKVWRHNWVRVHTSRYAGTLYHNMYVCAVILNPFGCWLSYYM